MRKRGRWMNKATEPVLEVLNYSGDWRSTSDLIVNIKQQFADPPGDRTVYRALDDMVAYEYVGNAETTESHLAEQREFEGYGTYYRITDLGKAFLDGDIDGGQFGPDDSTSS